LSRWITDIETAIEEIKHRGALAKVCLIGARVGATLSVLAGGRRSDLEAVVLWDPIVNGECYLDSLNVQHQDWLSEHPTSTPQPNAMFEVLGLPINSDLVEGFTQVNLLNVGQRPARHVLTLETDKTRDGELLRNHLIAIGVDSEYQHIEAPRVWLRRRGGDNVVVPAQMLRAIVSWVSRIIT
jgi:hypothetical protein